MTLFNIITFALLFRIIGGMFSDDKGNNKVPRYVSLPTVAALIVWQVQDVVQIVTYGWLFYVVRLLPTQALFSAVHGQPPTREDKHWNFLQTITFKIWKLHPTNYYVWGIIYGFVRASLAIPAMIYLGGLSWLFLAQGMLYFISGRICNKLSRGDSAVASAEVVSGIIFGGLV